MGGIEELQRKAQSGELPGKQSPKGKKAKAVPTEHEEQSAFFTWADKWLPEDMRPLLFAIPNGGHRFAATAGKLKAEGVRAGVPDVFFSWARLGYHGLYLEMKRTKGGTLSEKQKDMIASLQQAGYLVVVCKGCEEAKEALRAYMIGNGKEFEE